MKELICVISLAFIGFQNVYAYHIGNADLKINTSVTETYDDNITYASTDAKKDYIANLLLGADLDYEGKTNSLAFSGNLKYENFADNASFNNLAEDFSAIYRQELSKFDRFSVRNAFIHAEEPRSFEDEFGRNSGRYAYFRNIVTAGYSRDVSRNMAINADYTNEIDTYSRSDLSDTYLNAIGLGAEYTISSQTILLAGYNFSVRKFDPGTDATTNALSAGIRQYFTKQLFLEGKAGIDFIRSYDKKNYARPLFSLSLADEVNETTKFNLSFKKEYFNNAYSQDLFNEWRISAGLNKQLLARLGSNISAFYGNGEYVESGTSDNLRGINCGFDYDLRDNIKVNLNYVYSETSSNVSTREYKRNAVSLGVKVDF
ncbi:MAG: outer membrane beta-barrel protein [Candidatus Omnitrophica bacterium]|nr:outer membrane beta-barrel protein [Candidatus Omnitrophota bacterium]